MAKCRPSKWLVPWALLGAGLPWLAAAWINTESLKADILQRATTALSGNESTAWAKVEYDGRDFLVSGTSPSEEAAAAAVKAVAETYGVRTAMASPQLKIEPPQPVAEVPAAEAPAAVPTPESAPVPALMPAAVPQGAKWPYAITGTWPEAPGARLTAKLAEQTYELGRGADLTTDGKGNFTFAPTAKLPPGAYDVEFTANDAAGAATTARLPGAIVIPKPLPAPVVVAQAPAPAETPAPVPAAPVPLAAPAVEKQLDLTGSPIIRGTWPEGAATGLTVTLGSKTFTLGKDANLSSKEGRWSLIPSASLKDGIYDIVVTATGAGGNAAKDESVAEIEVDAVPPDAPAVTAYSGEGSPASIAGTWAEQLSSNLKVSIPAANLSADLGAPGSPLTSDGGGNWTLALPNPLPPGSYDVEVSSTDNRGRMQTSTSAAGLVVTAAQAPAPAPQPAEEEPPAAKPPVPVIGLYAQPPAADAVWPYPVTGRWSEGTALNLKARLAGRTYEFGKEAELSSDGMGVFTFAPPADLSPGTYTVWFTSKGPAGDVRVASATITVPPKAEPAPPPDPESSETPETPETPEPSQVVIAERPFDCEGTLNTLNKVFPVRFGFDKANLEGIASLSLSQYAALLKDPRCAAMKVEIGGHADYLGPAIYNQGLSERRAATVLSALREAGVTDSSLSARGYGEKNPLDPAQTGAAREKNRRVEFTVVK